MALDTSKFLAGNGSEIAPFIIDSVDGFIEVFRHDSDSESILGYKYFELVTDIDLSVMESFRLNGSGMKGAHFNGNGHSVIFPMLTGSSTLGWDLQSIRNIHFHLNGNYDRTIFGLTTLHGATVSAVYLTGYLNHWRSTSSNYNYFFSRYKNQVVNSLVNLKIDEYWPTPMLEGGTGLDYINSYFIEGSTVKVNNGGNNAMISEDAAFLASSYPALDPDDWVLQDGALPQLKVKPYSGKPITRIAGTTKLNGTPASRRVTITDSNGGRISRSMSDPETGRFEVQTSPFKNGVTVIVDDDIGYEIQPNKTYSVGDKIYHSEYSGIFYECTNAGDSPETLPVPSEYPESGFLTIGTATFKAKAVNKPQIFSPVRPEIILE
ncbi:hypothetical protein [Gayadomonas joobiniege]|uniref:hypothetical protein n=1 Tax=Gayadomonas joobiniege TaxID=1234606 RepID=UPI000369B8E4|nr:hypothetical protein [Gayadomonas joobiniege]